MSDDIVTRLRNVAPYAKAQDREIIDPYYFSLTGLVNGAADEIERLRAEVRRLEVEAHVG